jgi:hypothetical protein
MVDKLIAAFLDPQIVWPMTLVSIAIAWLADRNATLVERAKLVARMAGGMSRAKM